MLEGHCFDMSTGQPPRGLQFTLGMSQDPLTYDTIVMANLVSSLLYLTIELLKILSSQNKCDRMLTVRTWTVSTTTGIFPTESQSWCLDPEIT